MPPISHVILALTRKAAGAITGCRLVGFDGLQATVQGQRVMGPAHTDAALGDDFTVDVAGVVVVEIGAAVSDGDALIVDATGRAIAATGALAVAAGATPVTSSAANGAILVGGDGPEYVFGDALQDGAQAGDLIEVLMRR